MARLIGIDPGQSGGIAILFRQHWTTGMSDEVAPTFPDSVDVFKMPETERDLLDLLKTWHSPRAVLEKVGPMPKQGISSTWKFGQHYGSVRMALIAAGIPFETVAPGVWQKALGCLTKGDKNVSKRKAQELFPDVKVTHATADALLIAEYGMRRWLTNAKPISEAG